MNYNSTQYWTVYMQAATTYLAYLLSFTQQCGALLHSTELQVKLVSSFYVIIKMHRTNNYFDSLPEYHINSKLSVVFLIFFLHYFDFHLNLTHQQAIIPRFHVILGIKLLAATSYYSAWSQAHRFIRLYYLRRV